jgi:hypothetical protein
MGGTLLLSGALLTQPSFAQDQRPSVQTLEGVISDGMCAANHGGKDAAKCTMSCVNNGKGWVLVVADKVYAMEGRMAGVSDVAGQKAKVTGRVMGNKISVTAVDIAE